MKIKLIMYRISYPNILAMKLHPLILLITAVLLNTSCKKQNICTDPVCQLPPVTQTGANTFGCLVGGKPWTANTSDAFGLEKLSVGNRIVNEDTFFIIRAYRNHKREGIDSDIALFIKGSNKPTVFNLKDNDAIGPRLSTPTGSLGLYRLRGDFNLPYETDSLHTGQVTITKYDAANKIAAGTFYFTAQNVDNDSIVHITDGRFDVILP